MNPRVEHTVSGDRVLISATFPPEAMTSMTSDGVTVTLDDQDWYDASKRVLRECNTAERGLDADVVALRIEQSLSDAVTRGVVGQCEPEQARRRAVAGALHRLADMIVSGTVREMVVEWPFWPDGAVNDTPAGMFVGFRTRRVGREVVLSLSLPERPEAAK